MELIKALNWRYATKRMTGEKIPQEKLDRILEAIRLSASSTGLQPYTVLVLENQELRKKLQPFAYNQPQIVEASHLLIFAAWSNITIEQVREFISNIAETRGVTVDSLKAYQSMIENLISNKTAEENYAWAAKQTYIALGTALVAAAVEGIDATPMEGFDPQAFDDLLQLQEKGLRSVSLLTLGYRDDKNDYLANAKKVRRQKEKLFISL
ncbi:MAG: NAD(P)H-dependent oxidoreductase [Blastocatellia bacterium]|nr:NAD(P)H-dependent oxidoreductase [Blastocatellia bacterium]MBN8725066.1 NAD(P)H-dependent oxidoreductase [Acidobacteriota bacterium]